MIFQKSATTLSRSTLAAKTRAQNLWGTPASQQSPPVPGFFVSTPQFTRHQQSQVASYQDDTRGAGNSGPHSESGNIGNPYLAMTGGANLGPAAPAPPVPDEERKEEAFARRPPTKTLHLVAEVRHAPASAEPPTTEPLVRDSIAEIIDDTDKLNVVDGMMSKMQRLAAVGSHMHVLATFEALIALREPVPVKAYNIALASLASTSDISVLLAAYEKMLAQKVRPDTQTYTILIDSLLSAALELSAKRNQLRPFIGTEVGILESVDEIMESLAVEEHLTLAVSLLQAFVATHSGPLAEELQASLNSVVAACIDHKVDVPSALIAASQPYLVPLIKVQPSIDSAAEVFSSLDPKVQMSELAQSAMLQAYFRLHEPRGAIAFFDGCGAPRYLLKPLLVGFASLGMVGTARRWVQKMHPDASVIGEVLKVIPRVNAAEYLPSATQLFYEHTGATSPSSGSSGDGTHSGISDGRSSFMRLCVAANHKETLYMALREAHLNDALLDPVTVMEVVKFLSANDQPMLAADLFAWQFPKLSKAWADLDITSFVGQEMASDTISAFQRREQLSLSVAITMLPCVASSSRARKATFDVVAAARLGAPHQLSELLSADKLTDIVTTLAVFYTRISGIADSELNVLRKLLPLFVEDALAQKCEFSDSDSAIVAEALLGLDDSEALVKLWHRRHPNPMSGHKYATAKESATIQRYALAPNGMDSAVDLLKRQLLLKKAVAPAAIEAVFSACAREGAMDTLTELYTLLPKARTTLNSLILVSVSCQRELAISALKDLKNAGLYADLRSYSALISTSKDVSEAESLFNEAKIDAKLPLSPQVYDDMAGLLARNLHKPRVDSLLQEMNELGFEVSTLTMGSIISMHARLDEGELALGKLKSMSVTEKSLLEVKTFNHLMHYFVHKKADRNAALEVFMELRSTGTLATPFTYRLLMEAYLLSNQPEKANLAKADNVLALMRHDGAPITTMCFATLLRARGVLFKDFDAARNFYRGLVKNSRVLPDQNIFKALMESYITNGKQSEATSVFQEMKRYHVSVDKDIAELANAA